MGAGDAKQFQGNPKYLYQYLSQNKTNLEFYWSAKNKEQFKALAAKGLPVINPYSVKGFFILLRAKYLVIEKSSFDVYYTKMIFGFFNFVQTWHGSPFKKVGVDAADHLSDNIQFSANRKSAKYRFLKRIKFYSRQKYKVIVSPSEEVSRIFKNAFENDNTVITGYPRNDVFFNPSLALNDYTELLGCKSYKKIILYAPTFRDNVDSVTAFSDDLSKYNEQLVAAGFHLVIKKHPWEKNLVVPQGLSNITDISSKVDDIQELLPYVDLLITDYSSSFYDHMLSGNHTIFYAYDFEDYLANCRGIYFDYKQELQGPFADNEEQLFELIFTSAIWTKDPAYKVEYERVLNKYNQFKDGDSSKRLLTYLFSNFSVETKNLSSPTSGNG